MAPKRSLEFSSPPPAAKRIAGPSSNAFAQGSSSLFSTPCTPKKYNLPAPSDSPTNPFGLSRPPVADPLKLPIPISYRGYLALRMQLVGHPSREDLYEGGKMPPFRIVHVPINYSFKLLQKLIMFMFECEPQCALDARDVKEEGHLFEICRSVGMHKNNARPGQMERGRIVAKLSSERDPYFRHGELDEEVDPDDEESEEADWSWENEEEFTLQNVWSRKADLRRGIIYHHNAHTIIHITINTVPLPVRKGYGNRPYTFLARGHVDLSARPPPEPTGDGNSSPAKSRKSFPQVKSIFPSGKNALALPPWMSRPKDMEAAISVVRWNAVAAWESYLDRCREVDRRVRLVRARQGRVKREVKENEMPSSDVIPSSDSFAGAPTPGLTLLSSSPFPYDSIPPTPDPKGSLHKLIVNRTSRRLSILTRKGMSELDSDEEEVDELAGDHGDGIFVGEDDLRRVKGKSMVKGIDRGEDGWSWDDDEEKKVGDKDDEVVEVEEEPDL